MNYLKALNLSREPFSNTPDPEFFFQSRQHYGCLQKLEVSIRLRRGLNVVIGDVGSGKTTLCRQMIRRLAGDDELETHLVLDPSFDNATDFLAKVAEMFLGQRPEDTDGDWQIKEEIKKYLFRRGVEDNKTVVLIVDEGQKIPVYCLEILREFLNYETNEYKLLQIVIFAQKEFDATIRRLANFADRINLYHLLQPLNFQDTREMIRFRLEHSSQSPGASSLFTSGGYWAVYKATGGFPRKIINLCHLCTLAVIIEKRTKIDWFLVRNCARNVAPGRSMVMRRAVGLTLLVVLVAGAIVFDLVPGIKVPFNADAIISRFSKPDKPAPVVSSSIVKKVNNESADPAVGIKEEPPAGIKPADVEVKEEPTGLVPPAWGQMDHPVSSEPAADEVVSLANNKEEVFQDASGEPQKVAALEKPVVKREPPAMLGESRIKRGQTLSGMIRRVYGVYNHEILDRVMRHNPHITDIEKIPVNRMIYFPAVEVDIRPVRGKNFWVVLSSYNGLDPAFDFVRTYPELLYNLRIVPVWSEQDGLSFKVVLLEYFKDVESAKLAINKLPGQVAARAEASSLWNEESLFYADVFQLNQ